VARLARFALKLHTLGIADGIGTADTAVILDLLDGRQDLADAVAEGRISATGSSEAIDMILHAIEIILDSATRIPALRALSAEFRASRSVSGNGRLNPSSILSHETEEELLARLGLLPGPRGALASDHVIGELSLAAASRWCWLKMPELGA
jgi:hypothetical protein